MIPRSSFFAALAVCAALSVHAAALVRPVAQEDVQIEGGGSVAPAAVGSSFADLVEGVQSPAPVQEITDAHDVRDPVDPVEPLTPTPVEPVEAQKAPPVTPPREAPQAAAQDAPPTPSVAQMTPVHAVPVATAAPVSPTVPEVAARTDPATAAQAAPVEAALVRPVTEVSDLAPTRAQRPKSRPTKTEPQKPKPKPPAAAASAARGNSAVNARAGSEAGEQDQKAAAAGSQTAGKSTQAGNATTSNYKGLIQRKIWRTRVARVSAHGTAFVKLQVAASGALVSVQVLRSSGNAKLDRVALQQVKKAAPFPPTPNGDRLTFTMGIKGE